ERGPTPRGRANSGGSVRGVDAPPRSRSRANPRENRDQACRTALAKRRILGIHSHRSEEIGEASGTVGQRWPPFASNPAPKLSRRNRSESTEGGKTAWPRFGPRFEDPLFRFPPSVISHAPLNARTNQIFRPTAIVRTGAPLEMRPRNSVGGG